MKTPAAILSLATTIPKHVIQQKDYAEILPGNNSFQQLCLESGIDKRHFCLDEEGIQSILKNKKSLTWRQELAISHVPELGLEASIKAIAAWGMPKTKITHVVFATSSGLFSPGADARLIRMLELPEDVHRVMVCQQHGYAGVLALRMAKDIAENNPASRVLVVCSEVMEFSAQAPEFDAESVINSVTLGSGAAAAIVGAPAFSEAEIARLELHHSIETIIAGDEDLIGTRACIDEDGMHYQFDQGRELTELSQKLPLVLNELVHNPSAAAAGGEEDQVLKFAAVHAGDMELLSKLESDAELKLDASRAVLASYGNLLSASVLFILDCFMKAGSGSNAAGEWGAVVGYGPGITLNTLLVKLV